MHGPVRVEPTDSPPHRLTLGGSMRDDFGSTEKRTPFNSMRIEGSLLTSQDMDGFRQVNPLASTKDLLEAFARFEPHGLGGRNGDFRSGLRVSAFSLLATCDGEGAEAQKLDTPAPLRILLDCVESQFHRILGFSLGEFSFLGDFLDQLPFVHVFTSLLWVQSSKNLVPPCPNGIHP
jgi:hypothetical protein